MEKLRDIDLEKKKYQGENPLWMMISLDDNEGYGQTWLKMKDWDMGYSEQSL